MKLIKIGNNIAINVDRIDGITPVAKGSNCTRIYVGGNEHPFIVDCPMDTVIEFISQMRRKREE